MAFIIGLMFTGELVAQESGPKLLAWKYSDGQELHYKVAQVLMFSIGESTGASKLEQQLDLTWTAQVSDEAGNAEIEQRIDRIQLSLTDSMGEMQYDSATDDAPGAVVALAGPVFKALLEHPIRFQLAANGAISELHIPEQILENMRHGSFTDSLSTFISEAGLKRLLLQGIPDFPTEPVESGANWTGAPSMPVENSLGLGPVEVAYYFEGENDSELARITSQRNLATAGSDSEGEASEPSMRIVEQSSDGELFFDFVQGNLVQNRWTIKLQLEFSSDKASQPGTLEQSFEMLLAPSDTDGSEESEADE